MTKFGKLFFTLLILAIASWATYNWVLKPDTAGEGTSSQGGSASIDTTSIDADAFIAVPDRPDRLPAPQTYKPDGDTIIVELSEYAGYAGLIVANGGLEPNPDSFITQNYGFKVKFTISEEDSWPALQSGKMAATATTVDVLAPYGRDFKAVVPAQIAFSRGADGIIVRKDIRRINDLKGKTIAAAPFNETEFFIRYLAQEANMPIHRLASPNEKPKPDALNLVFGEDAFQAADAFLADLESGGNSLAGCVTWAPKTTEVVEASNGAARQLVDNTNLLIISDILIFNSGFAEENPEMVKGIVHGLIHGNDLVRNDTNKYAPALAEAFKEFEWSTEDAVDELSKVHLSNLPENLAFFSGATDASGSFDSIYGSSILAYGSKTVPNPAPASHFVSTTALESLQADGLFNNQQIALEPVRSNDRNPIENDPLLSKDIRFLFQPNSAELDMTQAVNDDYLTTVQKMLQVSPGSVILLRGHVDDSMIPEFRKQGGEALVRKFALKAMELSKQRAGEVRTRLLTKFPNIAPERLELIGRGWEEPEGDDPDQKRRVEVQWFTVE
ncbi:MAG: hypothetical protein P8J87_05560 [Verrucomicrobiales bacterium]|nr:hypothetical protein [Verrucomicrobiales bacterium]